MPGRLDLSARETGFFGKLPSQGDFVGRGLPAGFIQTWDGWLQRCNAHTRHRLGTEWGRLFREAPVWWFLLAPGTCGDSSWAGLMQPSIDRVGRLFPLTISAELPGDLDVLETIGAAQGWYRALERDAAAAFDPAVSLESIAARLRDSRFPGDALIFTDSADDTLPIVERSVSALRLSRGDTDDFVALRTALLEERVIVGHSHCVWMNSMSSEMQCSLLVTKTLPEPEQFCAFLDGRWEVHGWECAHAVAEPRGESRAQG